MISSIDNKCSFSGEIVSYMYGESAAGDRTAFESHLRTCVDCTDEFAELADARFSVYEWNKIEFVPLASPAISIPYDQPAAAAASAGFLNSVRELFAFGRTPAMAAAVLTIVIGAAFAAVFLLRESEQQIAANVVVDETEVKPPQPNEIGSAIVVDRPVTAAPRIERAESEPIRNAARPVKKSTARPIARKSTVAAVKDRPRPEIDTRWQNYTAQRRNELPVLTDHDDNDDRSLRLTDLIDDDGSRR